MFEIKIYNTPPLARFAAVCDVNPPTAFLARKLSTSLPHLQDAMGNVAAPSSGSFSKV
jgi:hypothetical protein